jgi:hypothetical protein
MNHYRNAYKKHVLEEEILGDETPGDTTAGDEIEQVNQEDIEVAKAELLARFQERFQEQIQQMIQNVEDLEEDISSEDVEKAQRALTHALQKMLHIQEKIESGKFDEAVDELDEATESLEDEFDKVSDPGTAQMLRTMNQLEARIQKMTEKAARKAAAGEDVSEEGALLEELRGNKNKMKAEFKQNQGHGGEHGNQGGQGKGSN